jgi:hypothetical protein
MLKCGFRTVVLAAALACLPGVPIHAATNSSGPSPSPNTVTGTDPVPTSPVGNTVLVTLLQMLL